MKLLRYALGTRRSVLWGWLTVLVVALLGMLIWLAGRYETSQIESRLERDATQSVVDIRSALTRNVQSFQALQSAGADVTSWYSAAPTLLGQRREIMRLEWRSEALEVVRFVDTPYYPSVFGRLGRSSTQADVSLACAAAKRVNGAAYSASYFLPQFDGLGMEAMDLCLPIMSAGQLVGFTVATYALHEVLGELVDKQLVRGQSLSFTEADGTRLAIFGAPLGGSRVFVARQLLDLPGKTLVLRLESRVGLPALFPNVLSAMVSAMSLALLGVLFLLARDMKRRLKVEQDLGEALAFRKAMEDSVTTGLRARDLTGRITYVNPAFCQMVGLPASQLVHHRFPSPYWPPELARTYEQRQSTFLSTGNQPREGYESVFMRPDGTRFAVLIMEAPLINAAGKHTGWMSAILDVSERRRAEEISRASQDRLQATARLAMVGEMASLLSHELNQPLAAISSYAVGSLNLLGEAASTPTRLLTSDLKQAIGRIAEQAERAGKVIKGVHDFVRRGGQARVSVLPLVLFEAIMPLVSLQARKLSITLVTDIDPACAAVLCDRTMVEQVLLNLARNGMQAMEHSASRVLTLRARPAASNANSGWLEFSVIDQGPGISPQVEQQLFTPFFTTKVDGMGLGLSLCRNVVEQHGGFLRFEAAQPCGTVFGFTLPTDSSPAAA